MALGLSRKEGESIFLETSDGVIEILITKFRWHAERTAIKAQIAIDAPLSVKIRRDDMKTDERRPRPPRVSVRNRNIERIS